MHPYADFTFKGKRVETARLQVSKSSAEMFTDLHNHFTMGGLLWINVFDKHGRQVLSITKKKMHSGEWQKIYSKLLNLSRS